MEGLVSPRTARAALAAGIATIVLAMVFGPALSLPDYSSLHHGLSEPAGQGMPGAWAMRTGFVAFGTGALVAGLAGARRNPLRAVALALFGLGLVGAAIWSHLPIRPDMPADPTEDQWHSVFASGLGLAFALAVTADLGARGWPRRDALGWVMLAATVVLPLGMLQWPDVAGLLQRTIFALSFVWLWRRVPGR